MCLIFSVASGDFWGGSSSLCIRAVLQQPMFGQAFVGAWYVHVSGLGGKGLVDRDGEEGRRQEAKHWRASEAGRR